MLSDAQIRELPTRKFAEREHTDLGSSDSFGVHRSNEAIDGYYGVGWYQAFEDPETKERYKIYCTDGVYGGKGPYKREDMKP